MFDPSLHPRIAVIILISAFILSTLLITEIAAYRSRRRIARDRAWIRSTNERQDD